MESSQLVDIVSIIIVFAFGISLGSFLNVVIERIPRGITLGGRSKCPSCFHELGLADLVPLLSFVILGSKCRYCRSNISWQYPAVELFTGLLFVFVYRSFNLPYSIIYILLFSSLLVLFVIDLKLGVVPSVIIFPSIVFAFISRMFFPVLESALLYYRLATDETGFGKYLIKSGFFTNHLTLQLQLVLITFASAFSISLLFYLLVFFTRGRGMGSGDIYYALLVALISGFPNMFVAIIASFLSGAFISVLLVVMKKKSFGQTIPLGPFLSFGAFIGVFWGGFIIDFYLNLLK